MNQYCKHKIHQFYASFKQRTFDQDDVALLMVLTRDYTKSGSIFRELGDFLAHPNEKDRGLVLNSLTRAAASFEKDCQRYLEDVENPYRLTPMVIEGLGTHEELLANLLGIFDLADLPKLNMDVDENHFRDFIFCVIFLLASFKIKHDGGLFDFKIDYSHSVSLYIPYVSKLIPSYKVIIPVFFSAMFKLGVWICSVCRGILCKIRLSVALRKDFLQQYLTRTIFQHAS